MSKHLADQDLQNNALLGLKTARFNGEYDAGNSGTSKTIDFANGSLQKVALNGACTFTLNFPGVGRYQLKIVAASGAGAVTWPTIKWFNSATAPTISTTLNNESILSFYYDGTTIYGSGGGFGF